MKNGNFSIGLSTIHYPLFTIHSELCYDPPIMSTMPTVQATKKFYLRTYGCQMNYHDSERIDGMMAEAGYARAEGPEDADVVVINTCAVREKPERKLFSELGRIRKIKEKRPELIVGVTGCMAPRDNDTIRARAPFVDLLIGPRSISRLPDLIRKVQLQRRPIEAVDLLDDPTPLTGVRRSSTVSAWVDVIFGCNYSCTYCAVPSARGKEQSRGPKEIFDEIDELVGMGYHEVTLLGQTVNAYGRDFSYRHPDGLDKRGEPVRIDFAWLLREIDKRAPNLRVRYTSPHPQLFSDRLIDAIAELPTVCEHFHFPLQSGDNEVLKRMRRTYNYEKFRDIVHKLRTRVPGISVTTDLIVGFPGETEEQFERTLDAYRELQFDQAYMFAYSPRRHTPALEFAEEELPKEVSQRRLAELIELANGIMKSKNEAKVGETFEVLVEGPSPKNPDRLTGRTRGNKIMVFEGEPELTNRLVQVRAKEGFLWGFVGEVIA